MRILLVEDDEMLGAALVEAFTQMLDTEVEWLRSAESAKLALVNHGFSMVLLDLGLPGESGLTVLKAVRARNDTTPVIVITARARLSQRILGLDSGADDYIVKPFELDELQARIRALVRRATNTVGRVLRHGDIEINLAERTVSQRGQPVVLSIFEYKTLKAIIERQGKVVTRETLELALYSDVSEVQSNTVAVYIHQLRRKLGQDVISTVHGFGYRAGCANS